MNIIRIKPPFIAIGLLLVSYLLHLSYASRLGARFPLPLAGIVTFVLGFVIVLSGWARFRASGTAVRPEDEPSMLVTSGPYRFTRNPMYLGVTLMLLGFALRMGSPPMLLAPIVFFLIINAVFIPYEEAKMMRIFGDDFLAYKKRVRRWI